MKIGTNTISNCKIGSTQINSVYIGSTLVWSAFDADALAFITAAGITNDTQKTAINNLVLALKTASLWTKIAVYYPFVGGTATTHKYNLKDPRDLDAAYRALFYGGLTHNANGITGNGSDAYADTLFSEASTYDNIGFFSYSGVNAATNANNLFGENGINVLFNPRNASDNANIRNYASITDATANTDSRGFLGMNRRGGTTVDLQLRTVFTTFSRTVVGTTNTIYLLRSSTNYATRNMRSAIIARNLSQADCLNLRLADVAFQTALGRNV
jgi:hypothetical protein